MNPLLICPLVIANYTQCIENNAHIAKANDYYCQFVGKDYHCFDISKESDLTVLDIINDLKKDKETL